MIGLSAALLLSAAAGAPAGGKRYSDYQAALIYERCLSQTAARLAGTLAEGENVHSRARRQCAPLRDRVQTRSENIVASGARLDAVDETFAARPQPPAATPARTQTAADESELPVEEYSFGQLVLKIDPEAVTFDSYRRGVIELSARSSDGKAHWYLRDNGVLLDGGFESPGCMVFAGERQYEDLERGILRGFTRIFARQPDAEPVECPLPAYLAEVQASLADFEVAVAVLKQRAVKLFGPDLNRCTTPERAPGSLPPLHPPCGFGPPEIGTRAADYYKDTGG